MSHGIISREWSPWSLPDAVVVSSSVLIYGLNLVFFFSSCNREKSLFQVSVYDQARFADGLCGFPHWHFWCQMNSFLRSNLENNLFILGNWRPCLLSHVSQSTRHSLRAAEYRKGIWSDPCFLLLLSSEQAFLNMLSEIHFLCRILKVMGEYFFYQGKRI